MGSKAIVFLCLSALVLVMIASEVSARDMAEAETVHTATNGIEGHNGGGGHGGHGGGGHGGGGHGGGGHSGGGKVDGHGRGGHCGCCGHHHCGCCSAAEKAAATKSLN